MALSKHDDSDSVVFFTIEFDFHGVHYLGRLTPEYKKGQGHLSSWHVVLNEVFFGYLHKDGNGWKVSEQRPADLTEKIGQLIDSKSYKPHAI